MSGALRSARLIDVADLNPPLRVSLSDGDDVSFMPMAAVDADSATAADRETRQYSQVKKGYTSFLDGDVLVAKITPCFENGKIAQVRLSRRHGFGSTEFHVVRPRDDRADARYVVHFLRQEHIRQQGESRMTGSAGQRRVPEQFLAGLTIPLPPLPEQQRIAAILDKADALRAKRRAVLAKLDTLSQSIFLDMFGDPATNPKGWPVRKVGDLLESAAYGTSTKAGTVGEFPVLRMNNVTTTGEIDAADLKYMDLADNERDRYLVRSGDVLFNRTNSAELVGKTAIYRGTRSMAYAGYLIRLRVNGDNDPEYLTAFLNTKFAKRALRGMCKSIIGMANINATEIQAMQVAAPPSPMQREFAGRVTAIQRLKAAHRTQLGELDALFASLQHRAFRGELTASDNSAAASDTVEAPTSC